MVVAFLASDYTCFIKGNLKGRGLYPILDPGGAVRNTVNNLLNNNLSTLLFNCVVGDFFSTGIRCLDIFVLNLVNTITTRLNSVATSYVGHRCNVGSCKDVFPNRNKILSEVSDVLFITPMVCMCLTVFNVFWCVAGIGARNEPLIYPLGSEFGCRRVGP